MPADGTILITDIGHAKLNDALNTETAVAIAEIAMGDGNGAVYAPGFGQTALKRELARVPITTRHIGGAHSWRITAEFTAATTPTFWVREIGFYDAEGDLIFLWAGADVDARQTGAIDYILEHVLSLDRIADGLVIVNAPDDAAFELAAATLHTLAILHTEQFRQSERIRALHGTY